MSSNDARVLIIEDNDALRVMLFTILRHQPLAVDTASTADEALDRVSQCDYALILLDVNLPNEESRNFLRRFREARPESTSFLVAVRDPNREDALDDVDVVLNKPLEIDTLAEMVRECAQVVPPPEEPLPCPPAESEIKARFERSGPFLSN